MRYYTLSVLLLLSVLFACKAPGPKLPGIGETAVLQDSICVTIQEAEKADLLVQRSAARGKVYLNTQILLENYSGKDIFMFNSQFTLMDQDSTLYKPLLSSKEPLLGPSAKVLDGGTHKGWVSFEIPAESEKLQLKFITDLVDGDTGSFSLEEL